MLLLQIILVLIVSACAAYDDYSMQRICTFRNALIRPLATNFCSHPILRTTASHPPERTAYSFTSPGKHIRDSQTISTSLRPGRTMATTAKMDESSISIILSFWFDTLGPKEWFNNAARDAQITEEFGALVEQARDTTSLDHWTSTPSGALALIILLDQFPRNVYREGNHPNPGLSWASDAKGLRVAAEAISKELDIKVQEEFASHKGLGIWHRQFFYLPFMHAEDLPSQVACVALHEKMSLEFDASVLKQDESARGLSDDDVAEVRNHLAKGIDFAKKHRDCVATLGLFPARSKPLGRELRKEDREWLEKYPKGF